MSRKRTIEMDAYDLAEMKAQEEQMKLSLSEMADELESTKEELETAKGELKVVTKDLRDTRFLLRSSVELQQRAEESAKMCEDVLRGFLNQWLTVENRAMVKNILRFYRPFQRINMINAVLTYLIFGKKKHMEREVEKTHFEIICERIDDDSVTLPPHSLMIKLMKRYGLNEALKEIALDD
jgi:hypothetical protein